MILKTHKYAISGLIISVFFWLFDSAVHYFFYREPKFEVIPSDFNELWMRSSIFFIVIGFGAYVDFSVNGRRKLQIEQQHLQARLEDAMTRLLGGFVSICSECKKVRNPEEELENEEIWENIESYIAHRSDIKFSHGYCPACEAKFSREIEEHQRKRHENSTDQS